MDSLPVDQVDDVNGSKVTEQLQSELPSNPISEKVLPRENNLGKVLATPAVRRIASEYKVRNQIQRYITHLV